MPPEDLKPYIDQMMYAKWNEPNGMAVSTKLRQVNILYYTKISDPQFVRRMHCSIVPLTHEMAGK